jgi:MFS family permease
MFAAVIFMPRFYQTVRGISATASGYYIWPLLVGLMGGSIGAGQIISRVGRYKWLMVGGAAVLLIGGFLLTHLTAGVSDWELWLWMLLLGLGIGPAMAGYTVVVQNSVPMNRLGVATSTLTFLRQIGASVGLAAAGTIFSSSFANRLPTNLAEQGVPQQLIPQLVKLAGALQNVGNGRPLLERILQGPLQPLIPKVIAGANDAMALAIGDLFWITIVAGVLGLAFTLVLRDLPLRSVAEMQALGGQPEAAPEARRSAVRLLVAASSYAVLRRRGPVPRAVVELVSAALDEYLSSRPGKEFQAAGLSAEAPRGDGSTRLSAEDASSSI